MIIRRVCYAVLLLLAFWISGCKKNGHAVVIKQDIETDPPVLTPVTLDVNACIGGFYSGLPAKYNNGNKKYPLLIFLHGGGQFGNGNLDLPLLLNEGVTELLDEKIFPPDFLVNGEHFSFIILAPQFRREPLNEEVRSFIDYAIQQYRADTNRIYLAGLSNGGKITCNVSAAYPLLFPAIVAMSGVSDSVGLEDKCKSIAAANLPMWIFHNESDQVVPIEGVKKFIAMVTGFQPKVLPRFTQFPSMGLLGHDAWTRATNPSYKEQGQNIYEWMLQYHK